MRAFLIAFAVLFGLPALAQQPNNNCGPTEEVRRMLSEQFGETQQSTGLVGPETQPTFALEVWANDETGTWTMLATRPDGVACIGGQGFYWNGEPEAWAHPEGEPS